MRTRCPSGGVEGYCLSRHGAGDAAPPKKGRANLSQPIHTKGRPSSGHLCLRPARDEKKKTRPPGKASSQQNKSQKRAKPSKH